MLHQILQDSEIKRPYNNQAIPFPLTPINIIFGSSIIFESKVNTTVEKDLDIFSVTSISNNYPTEFQDEWRITTSGNKPIVTKSDIILTNPMTNVNWIENNINKGVCPYDPIDQNNNGNADPGYDYFKLHWPSKKSTVAGQTEAYVNRRAKYPDDQYDITFKAEDISGNASTVPYNDMILGNHQPYVEELTIYSGNKIYGATVGYDDPVPGNPQGKLRLTVDQQAINDCADYENKLEIFVTTSEPMKDVSIEIEDTRAT